MTPMISPELAPRDSGLPGLVGVVAGATRGIGLEVAYALAGNGVSLVVNGRDPEAVEETVREIIGGGGQAVGVSGSAGAPGVAQQLVDRALSEYGALDLAVNCAGIAEPAGSTVLTISRDEFAAQLDAHLLSAFELTRAAGRVMAEQRSGAIVLTGSAASLGMFGGSGYPAAKGGVNALALAAAADLREFGVRVNVVMPGARSRLSTGEDYLAHIESLHRRGILDDGLREVALAPAPPEHVAQLYAYLCSGRAAGLTGQIYSASGGFIGRYDPADPAFLTYRDHEVSPPYALAELHTILGG